MPEVLYLITTNHEKIEKMPQKSRELKLTYSYYILCFQYPINILCKNTEIKLVGQPNLNPQLQLADNNTIMTVQSMFKINIRTVKPIHLNDKKHIIDFSKLTVILLDKLPSIYFFELM